MMWMSSGEGIVVFEAPISGPKRRWVFRAAVAFVASLSLLYFHNDGLWTEVPSAKRNLS